MTQENTQQVQSVPVAGSGGCDERLTRVRLEGGGAVELKFEAGEGFRETGNVDSFGRKEVALGPYVWHLPTEEESKRNAEEFQKVFPNARRLLVESLVQDNAELLKRAETAEAKLAETPYDYPEWDNTDGAHPAFWRGQEDGVNGAVRCVREYLAGDFAGVNASRGLEAVKGQIRELLAAKETAEAKLKIMHRRAQKAEGELSRSDIHNRFEARTAELEIQWNQRLVAERERDEARAELAAVKKSSSPKVELYDQSLEEGPIWRCKSCGWIFPDSSIAVCCPICDPDLVLGEAREGEG